MGNESAKYLIKQDFKKFRYIIPILCIGMMSLFVWGYCGYILILLFPLIFQHGTKLSKDACLVAVFGIMYSFGKIISSYEYVLSNFVFDLCYPLIMFQTGKYITEKSRFSGTPVIIMSLMAIFLAIPAIYYCVRDTASTGQIINVLRNIEDESGDITRAATGYGMMLSIMNGSFAVFFLKTENSIDKRLKYVLCFFSIGALFATIHLLNRTGLVIAFICTVVAILISAPSKKKIIMIITFSSLICFGAILLMGEDNLIFQAIELYEARNESEAQMDDYEYGGRIGLWTKGLSQIISSPLGSPNGIFVRGKYTYAHNLLIDAGVFGGILSAVILLIIFIRSFTILKRLYRKFPLSNFEKYYFLVFTIAMLLQSAVEPVIEGVPQLFWILIFWYGIIIKWDKDYREFIRIRHK